MPIEPTVDLQRKEDGPPLVASPSTIEVTGACSPETGAESSFLGYDPPAGSPTISGYLLTGEIARGGMGVVYRARDVALNREVAIKVLQERYSIDGTSALRFVEEAQITGQIQHPGIPPIHQIGQCSDGRPFLAMKLIKGRTLDSLLNDRNGTNFIAIFEAIAQAVGYAHAHGVIHRDLKPANIMVGSYGEVQVMDWGLAKLMGSAATTTPDPDSTHGTEIRTPRDGDNQTLAGSVLGTAAFMPPEQAIGAIEMVDARSDVFGLGAILCVILTGRPPYVGGHSEGTRQLAARAKLDEAFAALDACHMEPELVALCKRCLSVEQAHRPADANGVAQHVASIRAAAEERAKGAELERAKAEVREAEQHKQRRTQLALAAALGLLLLGGGAVAWWQQALSARREAERRLAESANRQAAESAIDRAEAAIRQENPAYGEINAALDQAAQRVSMSGSHDLQNRLAAALSARRMLERLENLADRRWTVADGKSVRDVAGARDGYRAAFHEYGLDLTGQTPEALADRVRQSLIAGAIQTALDDWLGVSVDERLPTVAPAVDKLVDLLAALDANPVRTAIRRAVATKDQAALLNQTAGLNGGSVPPSFAVLVGDNTLLPEERRRQILRETQASNPSHFGLALATEYALPPTAVEERLGYLRTAAALRPENAVVRSNLGVALFDKRDFDGAIAAYHEAIRLNPKFPNPHVGLARVLREKKELKGALAACMEAIRLDPDYASAHNEMARALHDNLDFDGALTEFKEAIRLAPKAANIHRNLGLLLKEWGNLDGAVLAYQEAIRLDPKSAHIHDGLGRTLEDRGDLDGAIAEFKESIRLDPTMAIAHNNLGWALQSKGDFDGAIAAYKEALRLDPQEPYSAQNLPHAERMRELLPRLPEILAGQGEPKTTVEACEFASLCGQRFQMRFAAAVRLYSYAFETDPNLANDLTVGHRYNAACFAARTARGDGVDASADPVVRAAVQARALAWLQADLAARKTKAESSIAADRIAAANMLRHWLVDPDLSHVRPGPQFADMPADERGEWEALWDAVRAACNEVQEPHPPKSSPLPREGKP